MKLEYYVVDVFTRHPLEGNALAVFPDAGNVDPKTMQKIARELNLSETTFLSKSSNGSCAARLRIFTPAYEMRFAGHPTVGSAHVMRMTGWVDGGADTFAIEENVGPVTVRIDGADDPVIWLRTPAITAGETRDRAACAAALDLREDDVLPGITCRIYSAGNPNLYVGVRDPERVDRAQIDTARFRALQPAGGKLCMYVFAPTESGAYSRMFAPELGVVEDPATGSAAGPLAAHMMDQGLMNDADGTRFTIEQGTKMGRRSFMHVLIHGKGGSEGVEVGGHVVTLAHATMTFPSAVPEPTMNS